MSTDAPNPDGFIIHYYFELRGVIEKVKHKNKKILIYTPYNKEFTENVCGAVKDVDILIKSERRPVPPREDGKTEDDRYILSLLPDIIRDGVIKFSLYRPTALKFDRIKIYELKESNIKKLLNLDKITLVEPPIHGDEKIRGLNKLTSEDCAVCYERVEELLLIDCCGGVVICAGCAIKYNRCPICKTVKGKFVYAGVERSSTPVGQSSSTGKAIISAFNSYANDEERRAKFIKMAEYGDIDYEINPSMRVLKTSSHSCDVRHFEYDFIITSSPLFNIYNIRVQFLATIGRGSNITIIKV